MIADPITEIIAHFIGSFYIATEDARLRQNYLDFEALKAISEEPPELPSETINVTAPYFLADLNSALSYISKTNFSIAEPLLHTRHLDLGKIFGSMSLAMSVAFPRTFSDGYISNSGGSVLKIHQELEFIPPGSLAALVKQQNILVDNDFLNTGEIDFEFGGNRIDLTDFVATAEASGVVHALGSVDMPASEAGIPLVIRDLADAAQINAEDETFEAQHFIGSGSQVTGTTVNGEHDAEAPLLADYLPEPSAAKEKFEELAGTEPKDDETTNSHSTGVGKLEVEAALAVDVGHNTLINQALLNKAWLHAPVVAVAGNSIELDVITQANVFSHTRFIDDCGCGSPSQAANPDTAYNIAEIDTNIEVHTSYSFDFPGGHSFSWNITELDGNLTFLNWVEQLNFMQDDDTAILSATTSNSTTLMGNNFASNTISLHELGYRYDLILVEGNYYSADIVSQANILLDEDTFGWAGEGFANESAGISASLQYSPAPLHIGDNLLWNQALITSTGSTDYFSVPFLSEGSDGLEAFISGLAANGILGNPDELNILKVKGDFLDLNYVKQTNILGDSDQIALMADAALQNGTWDVSAGSNALINLAAIVEYGPNASIYVGGEQYSDSFLFQAELITDHDPARPSSSDDLASEAVVFLADNMLADTETGPDAPDTYNVHDTVHADLMQVMLS